MSDTFLSQLQQQRALVQQLEEPAQAPSSQRQRARWQRRKVALRLHRSPHNSAAAEPQLPHSGYTATVDQMRVPSHFRASACCCCAARIAPTAIAQ